MPKKRILIIAGVLIIVIALVSGGLLVVAGASGQPIVLHVNVAAPAKSASPAPEEAPKQAMPLPTPVGKHGLLIDFGSKVVNLSDPGGYRYLKIGLVLEFVPEDPLYYTLEGEKKVAAEEKQKERIHEWKPMIEDALIGHLSDCAFNDIFSLQGKEKLKEKLKAAINERLGQPWVSHIYFTDFVIQ